MAVAKELHHNDVSILSRDGRVALLAPHEVIGWDNVPNDVNSTATKLEERANREVVFVSNIPFTYLPSSEERLIEPIKLSTIVRMIERSPHVDPIAVDRIPGNEAEAWLDQKGVECALLSGLEGGGGQEGRPL